MGIRGMLRAAVLLLLIRTWLAESNGPNPTPKFHFELSSSMPEVILDLFNCKNCANEAVVQKILDRVLSTYDVRLRPNFGGAPVPVSVSIYVSSIEQISEINMDYTITMFLHQTWKDTRLAYYETNLNLTLDYHMHEKLWVPDCYFVNSKNAFVHDVTVENRVFQLHPDGTVRYGIRLTTTADCSLDLQKFPMDKQACKLEVESYGYTVEDIVLSWEDENAIHITDELHIPQFTYLGRTITSKEVYFYTGSYMRLIVKFQVQREVHTYLVQVYWPTVLTTILSWISFWMNYDSSAARVTIGLTSILVLTTIDSHMRDKLPHISCIKAIDIYILVCLFFVFLSLLEYVYINYLFFSQGPQHNRRRCKKPRRVVARYRYQEVVVGNVQDGLINVEDRVEDRADPLPDSPMQAHLASLESLGSLVFTSEQAQLATSESLSPLYSTSSQAQLATGESLSDLPSTSQQIVHDCTIHFHGFLSNDSIIPIKIHNHSEAHGDEDSEESLSSESHGHDSSPSGRLMFHSGQRCVQEASWDLDKIESLQDDISIKSSWLGLDELCKGDADNSWSLTDEELMACDQEKDHSSEPGESCSSSPGCSFNEGFSFQIFNPDRVPKVDRWSRFLFPLSFGLFNVVYWLYHIY
ncbi:gamma-aminobutyric acid receptor subunit theta isoform X1 [Onychomys torridus]|uniref:gamma-aminobutyric acid receptor subunit theta isoform X1 n=1 Tax=Onychomys torridus TaxID=38674 RepID=UPI00167F2F2D|nr:gamma-aminobutyric acid receptor subunit theta isoform X1 [Onychomys torridus]XP_036030445.1 gamma-aminobutyric acid receptor subunit theta isoform X1 [Onychomys torridus]